MHQSFFPKRPTGQLYEPFIVIALAAVTAAVGIELNIASIAMNTFLAGCCLWELWRLFRGRQGLYAQQAACEIDVQNRNRLTVANLKHQAVQWGASAYLQGMHSMWRKFEAGRNPDCQTTIDALRNKALQVPGRAKRQAGVIVSFGMAGTLLGLAMTSNATAGVLEQSDDFSGMTEAMLPAFGNLAVAYSTTLTALMLGAILLVWKACHLSDDIDDFFDQLEAQLSDVSFQRLAIPTNGTSRKNGSVHRRNNTGTAWKPDTRHSI